ncbi:MAG: hypothetical protein AB2614_20475, partial [Candidatus Thiodiazotropha endolucinida]
NNRVVVLASFSVSQTGCQSNAMVSSVFVLVLKVSECKPKLSGCADNTLFWWGRPHPISDYAT